MSKRKGNFTYARPRVRVYAPRNRIYCRYQFPNCPYFQNTGKSICCVWCPDQLTCSYNCSFLRESKWKACIDRISRKKWITYMAFRKIFIPPIGRFRGVILSTPFFSRGSKNKRPPKQKVYKSRKGKK